MEMGQECDVEGPQMKVQVHTDRVSDVTSI